MNFLLPYFHYIQAHTILFLALIFFELLGLILLTVKYIHDRNKNQQDSAATKPVHGVNIFFLFVAILLSAVSFVVLTFTTVGKQSVGDTRSKAADVPPPMVTIAGNLQVPAPVVDEWKKLLDAVPTNPDQVIATAAAQGTIFTLTSGNTYSHPTVTFSWSGAKAKEPETNIVGYYVYFGPEHTEIPFPLDGYKTSVDPKSMGVLVSENVYKATNLVKGTTYYLYIQSVSDSKNPNKYYQYGLTQVGELETLSAKSLFTYTYK